MLLLFWGHLKDSKPQSPDDCRVRPGVLCASPDYYQGIGHPAHGSELGQTDSMNLSAMRFPGSPEFVGFACKPRTTERFRL